MKYKCLLIGLLMFFSFSCSVKQDMSINPSLSGVIGLDLDLHPLFTQYIMDLAESQGTLHDKENQRVFDAPQIIHFFNSLPSLSVNEVNTPALAKLNLNLSFSDFNSVFAKSKDKNIPNIADIKVLNDYNQLSIYISRKNISQIIELLPLANNPAFESFLPFIEDPTSEEEFLEMIVWTFEEYTEEKKIEEMIHSSYIELSIKFEKNVISSVGGKVLGKKVFFKIPLIKLFTLEKPLIYSVKYIK